MFLTAEISRVRIDYKRFTLEKLLKKSIVA